MKFSFFMMPVHRPTENPSIAFERDISLVHFADELGYDEFLIGEHHSGGWETMPAPEMALSMAAAKAHRIRLGTSVISLPYHHPFHVAERMAFLDHLTRGRAILGIGPSNLITDKMLFGLSNNRLYPMMAEAVDVIVRLFESDQPIDHDGEFWKFENMRLQLGCYQKPRMPIAIASSGSDASLELVGRHEMILMSTTGKKHRYGTHAEQWAKVEGHAAKHGKRALRDNWRLATCVYLAETEEQAWADVREGIMREAEYFSAIGLKATYEQYPGQPFDEFTPESCADMREWIIGTPETAIQWIEKKQKETGGFGGVLLTVHDWTDHYKARRSLDLFARYVMPHFRGHTRVYQDEWQRIRARAAATEGGVMQLQDFDGPSNLGRY